MNVNIVKGTRSLFTRDITVGGSQFTDVLQRSLGLSFQQAEAVKRGVSKAETRPVGSVPLTPRMKLTMDNVRDAQHDIYNIPFAALAKEIVNSGTATPQTTAALKDWDGMMRADSKAAVLVNEIRNCMANHIADANKPAPVAAIRERILYWAVREKSARWLPPGFASWNDLIKTCDETSRADLTKRLGPDESNWRWENIFRARFFHPLSLAPLIGAQFLVEPKGVPGSGQTPNVGPYVSMRHISSPGNWDSTRFVIPLGQSGDTKSPHFKDQFEAWRTGSPQTYPFTKAAVDAATKVSLTFSPKK